jgi:hypothetical protein
MKSKSETIKNQIGVIKMETNKNLLYIRTLGNGSKVYFESNKYRVNEAMQSNNYILNVGNSYDLTPIEHIKSSDLKELLFYANYLQTNWAEGLCSDNVNEVIKRMEYHYKEAIK